MCILLIAYSYTCSPTLSNVQCAILKSQDAWYLGRDRPTTRNITSVERVISQYLTDPSNVRHFVRCGRGALCLVCSVLLGQQVNSVHGFIHPTQHAYQCFACQKIVNIILDFFARKLVNKMLGNILKFGGENNVLFEHFFHHFGRHELHTFYWLFSQFFGTRNIDMHVVPSSNS